MKRYTIREAARESGTGESTIRRAIKSGKLPAKDENGKYLIDAEALQEYFAVYGKSKRGKTARYLTIGEKERDTLIEELRERIRHLEDETAFQRELIRNLTTRQLTAGKSEDTPGIVERVKTWFVGKKKEGAS